MNKTNWYTAHFSCASDSGAWGKAGAHNTIANIEAEDESHAKRIALRLCPGNWRLTGIIKQDSRHGYYRTQNDDSSRPDVAEDRSHK